MLEITGGGLRPILPHPLLPLLLHPLLERMIDTQVIMTARSFRIESSVRGHHVYKDQWTPSIGEEIQTTRELYDSFAVAVTKEENTVGHVPREISRICYFWRGTTQLHAKLLTSANILTFKEKYWKFHASSHLLANQDVDKLIGIFRSFDF